MIDNIDRDDTDDDRYEDQYDNEYDRVTARDIADPLHHLAEMRCSASTDGRSGVAIDPAERAAFLTRKAELFTRIARRAERTRVDDYSRQVRQMATDARTAAEQTQLQPPQQRMGPTPRRTSAHPATAAGARSRENSGARSG
jgi:hypothetical protein